MWNNIISAIQMFCTLSNAAGLIIGLLVGIVIGAIPGLGPTLVIALAMPMVISLPATTAIITLIGVYVGGIYGGSISAIWINTPGTPAAAATTLDGYQMRKKGLAMRALKLSLWASIFGHFFGSICLFFAAEPLSRVSLKFGPAEQFALVLFALTIISVIAGKDKKKGLVSAVFGLLFVLIGTDPITGSRRMNFGTLYLADGVELFALLIGLFALPEVFKQLADIFFGKKEGKTEQIKYDFNNREDNLSLKEFFSHFWLLIRSSIIGTFIGALPGIGSGTSVFVAYGWAQKLSKHPETFGEGSPEGIIAAESANNACCGGAMVPLLSLGIPGDTVTAVLLGALVMQGMAPGPLLFSQQGDKVRVIYLGIFCCGVLLMLFGRAILKSSTLIAAVNPRILWPVILIVCILGVYSANGSMFDVYLMLAFGVMGYLMNKYKFPGGPMIISFILGELLEKSLRQALLRTRNDFFVLFKNSTLFTIFMALAVLMIVFPVIKNAVQNRNRK